MNETQRVNWLESRRRGIGGTDSPRIMGISPWGGPYEVYCEKLGLVSKPFESPESRLGRALEPTIAAMYAEEFGVTLTKGEFFKAQTPEWLFASPDYFVQETADGMDCKLVLSPRAASKWGEENTDQLPHEYWGQGQHYLLAFPAAKRWIFAPLIEGRVRQYIVQRDEQYQAMLLETCEHFYRENMLGGVEPVPGALSACKEYLIARYPNNTEGMLTSIDEETEAVIQEILSVRAAMKPLKSTEAAALNYLRSVLGPSEGIDLRERGRILWRSSKSKEVTDWQAALKDVIVSLKLSDVQIAQAQSIIAKHRSIKPGQRRLTINIKGEEEDDDGSNGSA